MARQARGTTIRKPVVPEIQAREWVIACHGYAEAEHEAIAPLRRQFADSWTGPGKGSMRHMEDQTAVALEAVRLARLMAPDLAFDDWAVLACPLLPGRTTFRDNLKRYAEDGAWAISPQVIPQCSLHSLPGQVSIILGAHGPNLGIGGWPGTEDQVWSAAWAIDLAVEPQGLWLIWTGLETDLLPSGTSSTRLRALAVALSRTPNGQDLDGKWRLAIGAPNPADSPWCPWKAGSLLQDQCSPWSATVGASSLSLRFVPPGQNT